MSKEAKLSPVQEAIEKARVEVLKCTTPDELSKFLADLEGSCKVPMGEADKYGFLLQALLVDQFEGINKKGESYWPDDTWTKFAELWLVAIHGR
jgi:hypothetical protein